MKLLVALAAISAASAQTIPEVAISQNPEFSTLVAALTAADLVDTLSGDGPFTVFAPTNAAFDKLPAGTVDTLLLPENKDDLIAVLTYHVVPGKIMSTDLSDGQEAATVQGEEVTITIADGTVKVNDATVTTPDVEASNGVVHILDSVLLPPAADEPTKNIVETAQSVDDLSTLVQAVIAADLVETLSGDGPFTVFAPTNEAFAALPEGTLEDLLKPENKDQLVKILTYHVVPGTVLSTDLTETDVPTLEGDTVKVMVDPITINGATVVTPDVLATNGVVHVIDQVLLPDDEPTDDTPAEPTQSIVEIASGDDRFSTLVAALQAADLVDALSGDGPFTVFAPTNDAFAALGSTVDDLLKPENKDQLQSVLLYHVLGGAEVLSTDLTDGQEAETLQGGKVLVRLDPVRINSANVIDADILATNGVIHVLDAVLIPCADDSEWHKKNEPAKDCAWVSQWMPRCNVKGEDNIRAWYGCPAACGTSCTDSGEWHKKGDDEKDCAWVASHPSESRCLVRGEDDTLAKDACPSACAPQ